MPDAYSRKARLAPVALAATPAATLGASAAIAPQRAGSLIALIAGALGIVVCGVVRDLGRRLQPGLWASWGGSPTLRRLRWTDSPDPSAVERLHRRVEPLLDEPLPTREEEAIDPVNADRRYEDAITILRECTRDRERFPLVFAENAEYGFRRNCLGLRPIAIAIAIVALPMAAMLILFAQGAIAERLARYGPGALVAAVAALGWWRLVNSGWVRRAAELYADRLLESISTLKRGP